MFLIFKSANSGSSGKGVTAVELSLTDPSTDLVVLAGNDLAYVDLSDVTGYTPQEYLARIVNNLDKITISQMVSGKTKLSPSDVVITGEVTSRKLTTWNSVVRPAWYKLAGTSQMSVI